MEEELADQLETQYSDDESRVPAAHNKLLGVVSKLYDKKRVKAPTRKEPSLEVSEFNLSQPANKRSGRVKVTELAKVLNKRAAHVEISQKLKSAHKRAKTLPKPLEKIHADKITRAAGYEHAKHQLNRWDAIVYKQKVADQLQFPLKNDTVKIHTSTDISKLFRKPTQMEIELAEVLNTPCPLPNQKEEVLTKNNEEKEEEYPLSLPEIIENRKMMAKLRAQQSYRQAKAARHSKIKSKKFHQIQRRARVKEQLRDFEELQKKDPEAALKKLEELERSRAEERISLRHRSTGQWAKNLSVRAKYDKEARIALAEQLSKSRELTLKLAQNKDIESEKEDEEEEIQNEPVDEDPNNPWVVKRSKEMEDFLSGYRKYWEIKEKENKGNHIVDTTGKLNSFQVEDNKSTEKKRSEKENCNPINETDRTKSDMMSSNNKDCSKNLPNLPDQNESVSTKNTFVVNDSPVIKQNKSMDNRSLSQFNISCISAEKNKNTTNKTMDKPKYNDKKNILKISCKIGSWTVSSANGTTNNKTLKSSKLIGNKNNQSSKVLGDSFKVTESKTTIPSPKSLLTTSNNKISYVNDQIDENGNNNRRKITKSLDEIFEEVEDKIEDKVRNKVEILKRKLNQKRSIEVETNAESEIEELPSLEFKKSKSSVDVDEQLLEQSNNTIEKQSNTIANLQTTVSAEVKQIDDIDPNKFLKVTPRQISSKIPEIMTEGDVLDDEDTTAEKRHLTISEAFAEDDVVDQFQKEKEEEVKKNSVGDVDLTLPGWGSWAGHNMKSVTRRKRKKFVIKFPKAIPRRDANRGNVIINEDADKPIKEHQLSEVPFPFTSVKEYEASIRAPLGSTWVPQTAHKKLTLPPVVTKQGAVIEPMDDSQLVKQDKSLTIKKLDKNNGHKRKR